MEGESTSHTMIGMDTPQPASRTLDLSQGSFMLRGLSCAEYPVLTCGIHFCRDYGRVELHPDNYSTATAEKKGSFGSCAVVSCGQTVGICSETNSAEQLSESCAPSHVVVSEADRSVRESVPQLPFSGLYPLSRIVSRCLIGFQSV